MDALDRREFMKSVACAAVLSSSDFTAVPAAETGPVFLEPGRTGSRQSIGRPRSSRRVAASSMPWKKESTCPKTTRR